MAIRLARFPLLRNNLSISQDILSKSTYAFMSPASQSSKMSFRFTISKMAKRLPDLPIVQLSLHSFKGLVGILKIIVETRMPITKELYGKTDKGEEVFKFILKNGKNLEIHIINYGGIITNIFVPDKNGNAADVVLGFDDFEGYKKTHPYFGAIIGRYANRISNGQFTLDGAVHNVTKNRERFSLHGGADGFDKKVWSAEVQSDKLVLCYASPDGEEGYPGDLNTMVSYQVTSDNKLVINYMAMTSKPTVINLTNHSYFNLAGHDHGTISDHTICINGEHYLPVDENTLPTGKIVAVAGTAMDLTKDTKLCDRLSDVPGEFGFDHNFCLGKPGQMKHVARVHHLESGRFMNVYSTEPGVQFYTGRNLKNVTGKSGTEYKPFASICLETQHYPDSPNQASFPSTVLRPGENYMQTTIYEFGLST